MEFIDEIKIDLNKLEEEWKNQPLLYEKYARNLAEELRSRDATKTDLDSIIAETAKNIRNNPKDYGLDKITESAIQETVHSNEYVKRAKKLLDAFNYSLQDAKNKLSAIETKKKALEYEVQLYIGQYFSVPREKNINNDSSFETEIKDNNRRDHLKIMSEKKKERTKTDKEKILEMSEAGKEGLKEVIGEKQMQEIVGGFIEKNAVPTRRRIRRNV